MPPAYPELARQMHVGGSVIMSISILPDGHVSKVSFLSGHPLLQAAAEEAVRQWKFSTGPEETVMTVSVFFKAP